MKTQIILLLSLLFSSFCYSQFSYNELISLRAKTKDEITNYLTANKTGWGYSGYDTVKDRHTWIKGNDKLMIDHFSSDSRIIKYYTIDQTLCTKISTQMGSTLEYELPYKIDYENEGLQVFKGQKYYVVIHTICKMTDPVCKWQIDIMTGTRFKTEKY
jgi:hypothetical protein